MDRRTGITLFLALLMAGCGGPPVATEPASQETANVTDFLGDAEDDHRFARAAEPREFHFPADHGAHPDFRTEWWYLTGNLEDDGGRHFGFQITFFRFAISAQTLERESDWATNQLWMAHFAVTDSEAGAFYSDEKFERQALDLAGAVTDPFRVWLADWDLASSGVAFFPLRLSAEADGFRLRLDIARGKPLVLQGKNGLDPKGPEPGNASYYYSFTRLPAQGSLAIDAQLFEVRGLVWMDREWSTSVLGPDLEGWNWFALQLDDGSDLMFYRLRRKGGGTSPFSGGILVAADGSVSARFDADEAELEPTAYWTSPVSGIRYGIGWRLGVPRLGLDLAIEPRIANQELDLSVRYWEGAVVVRGSRDGADIAGVGYAEHAGVSARD